MGDSTIRPAYSRWPAYDQRLRDVVSTLPEAQLALLGLSPRGPLTPA